MANTVKRINRKILSSVFSNVFIRKKILILLLSSFIKKCIKIKMRRKKSKSKSIHFEPYNFNENVYKWLNPIESPPNAAVIV